MLYLSHLASDTAVPSMYRTRYHNSSLITILCHFIPLLTSLLPNTHFHVIFVCQSLYSKKVPFNGFLHHNSVHICCLNSVATSISYRHFLYSIPPRDIVSNPLAARSMAWVCGRSLAGIVGSNPAGGMDVCLLCVFRVVRWRSLRRTNVASTGILPRVVRLNVAEEPHRGRGQIGQSSIE